MDKGINKCVRIPAGDVFLLGDLQVPEEATALVIFAYANARCRNSPRPRHKARMMRMHAIGTLLCELLTEEEEIEDEISEKYRHDADFLANRLVEVTRWVDGQPDIKRLPIGFFGVCAGGAAAVIAAAQLKDKVGAVVSRGGRMDLAVKALPRVQCPTLLIVGQNDMVGMELNREALTRMTCKKQLAEIAGASHMFGEPGLLAGLGAVAYGGHLLAQADSDQGVFGADMCQQHIGLAHGIARQGAGGLQASQQGNGDDGQRHQDFNQRLKRITGRLNVFPIHQQMFP